MKFSGYIIVTALSSLVLLPAGVAAQQTNADGHWQQGSAGPSQMVRGGVGLLQTPTARMLSAGSMTANYTDNEEYRFWSVSIQLFDWMETTARYTDVRTQLYSPFPGFSNDQTYKDKGLDVKFRLLQESSFLPQVSMGFNDFGGTGLFESEYIALSKAWGALDFHIGMGWGYLGTAGNTINPFCELRDGFCNRPTGFSGSGGKIDYQKFFKGPASLFGGIEYQTPWRPLKLKLEYEGNNYQQDYAGELIQDSRWNIGAVYQWQDFTFDLNYQRGNTLGFGLHYQLDLNNTDQPKIKPAMRPVASPRPQIDDFKDLNIILRQLLSNAGFYLKTSRMTDDEFILYGHQLFYRDDEEATERLGRVVLSQLPSHIKRVRVVEFSGNLPLLEKVIDVETFASAAAYEQLQPDIRSTYIRQAPAADIMALADVPYNTGFYTGAEIFWIQSFGNPEVFYMYQGGLFLGAGYRFTENFSFNGAAKLTLLENFDKFNFKVDALDTPLPRVRTYAREYVTRSKLTMENAYGHWQKQLGDNLFVQAYGGYLETMFGGVGTELLYRPVDSNFAFGFDLNYVRQRSFENDLDFFDYKTVTGHINLYWQPEFLPDTRLTFNIGQFLAKDKGVNVDFAKRFDSGIIIGAYAAITNVPSEDYGEGSFTKGFYLSLPFDLFSVKPAKGRGRLPWVPIGRDGGQPLNRPVKLIDMTEARSGFID
ncbi:MULTISPECIES: YjbH domain-containing protein [unclassified Arsukibacterium]|uniref:YjbH domain-containing protein n=1 Tax=unclassified Arsukibacterium TaxID=2635278 RepID=UPI000C8D40DF|nr:MULTISPECIES: YjbH domain-containing protein [unclassified Arsukibacterium]MAA95110.1 polysaccharide biosynthesis protein [Rheinheimera sp.]HAW94439.1 YjbH domain-containing protein [Candidatus Azambacteria bacterium]|tara:strand:+ start:56478 stop:58595 length:2118 start_codon:yes stop_codon:yes gene_type:complete